MATTTAMISRIKRRERSSTWLVMLVSAVVALFCSCSVASASSSSSTVVTFNLSHQSHVPWPLLQQAVEDHFHHQDENAAVVVLNLSHLSLGDAGVQQVFTADALLNSSGSNRKTQRQLILSMNRLTPVGVTWLLQQLLSASSSPTSSNSPNDEHANTTVTTNDDVTLPPIQALDLSWNYLASDALADTTNLPAVMEKLVGSSTGACPTSLCLDQCSIGPALCRAIAKGLMQRFLTAQPKRTFSTADDDDNNDNEDDTKPSFVLPLPPLSLSMSGNPEIGDAGTAALAAALRTIATTTSSIKEKDVASVDNDNNEDGGGDNDMTNTLPPVLERLDLSSCSVGDAGAEALAIAIEDGCGPQVLDLSNNQLSDAGVAALGRAMAMADHGTTVRVLDVSNNAVGVAGCTALLVAMGKGRLSKVVMRSCHIQADGAEIIGKGLGSLVRQNAQSTESLEIDLSGNPLGVLRGKNKKEGGKYSASRLKSTATATATSYMNLLKKGMKDIGMDAVLGGGGASTESDDEEGEDNNSEDNEETSSEFAKKRCGAKSMANAFLKHSEEGSSTSNDSSPKKKTIRLGLRHCFFDHEAADALAAMVVEAQDKYGVDIVLDVAMNPVLEDEMVNALHGDDVDDDRLREMAERHLDILEALKEAQERAAEARAMARARVQSRKEWNSGEEEFDDYGGIPNFDDDDDDDEEDSAYDSDEDSY